MASAARGTSAGTAAIRATANCAITPTSAGSSTRPSSTRGVKSPIALGGGGPNCVSAMSTSRVNGAAMANKVQKC